MELGADELLAPTPGPRPLRMLPTGRRKGDRPLIPVDPFVKLAEARFLGAGTNRATVDLRRALLAHYVERAK